MKHRMFGPILFQVIDGKPFEQLFLSLEIGFKGGNEQTFSEAARAAEAIDFSFRYQAIDKCCLIHIYIVTCDDALKILYADRVFHNRFP